MEGKLF